MFVWGAALAHQTATEHSDDIVTVQTSRGELQGKKLFFGNGAILLAVESDQLEVVRLDSGTVVKLGEFHPHKWMDCIDIPIWSWVRNKFGSCLLRE